MVKSISSGDSAALGLKYAPAFLGDLMEVLSISLVTGLTMCTEGFLEQTTKDLDDLEKSNGILWHFQADVPNGSNFTFIYAWGSFLTTSCRARSGYCFEHLYRVTPTSFTGLLASFCHSRSGSTSIFQQCDQYQPGDYMWMKNFLIYSLYHKGLANLTAYIL